MNDGGERFVASIRRRLGRLAGRGVDAVDLTEEGAALAADLQWLALERSRRDETRAQARLAALLDDREGRLFTAALTDQMDRARSAARTADQIVHLMDVYELPRYLGRLERAQLRAFRRLGPRLPRLLVPLVRRRVRRETAGVVISAEEPALSRYLTARAAEGVRVNLNQLGETIVGEAEAERRVARTLEAIARPDVSCVSVKISSIGSQLELLAWEETLGVLAERLRTLLRGALAAPHRRPDGREEPKRVVLDMEAYDHQQLTLALLRHVLDEPEFLGAAAGVALQAYLPDAHPAQCELVAWARERAARGGAPVRVRLVKGANLAAERCASALRGWPQAPYHTKLEVDARYKHMLLFGSRPENAVAAPLGVASHNVFDIAFGLVVRALAGVEAHVGFEMLAGMAEPLRRAVQEIAGDVLVYSPAVSKREFHSAIAYLIRRLDENTSPENFLRVAFGLRPGSEAWALEERRFRSACRARDGGERPRREQDRRRPAVQPPLEAAFSNEPDTDFALVQNRTWIQAVAERWRCCETRDVPCQVAGELVFDAAGGWQEGRDPSQPERRLYRVALGDAALAERAVASAERAAHGWGALPIAERSRILGAVARSLRDARGELIGVMMADGGKAIRQADPEVSEAIDFAEYYRRSLDALAVEDVALSPLGVVLVTPPWNFPVAIPAGGVLAALMAGNAVILKPAPESTLAAWVLVQCFWEAGVPREVLQFLPCPEEPVGSALVSDPRIAAVVLTGASATARRFIELRSGRAVLAETGGKNAFIVTALADRDLAIQHVVRSAFGHAGQKCSAASLLVCEAEVYDDPAFRERLVDAARSLHVGSAWDPRSVVTPLIRPPEGVLRRGLTRLEPGEQWLLEPRADPHNPALWSPGIKLGVRPGSFTHRTELFGPVLGVLRAEDLDRAIALANATPYGLTGGLASLDEREWRRYAERIEVGNAYVNRATTGAIVRRQPFGGFKASSFGPGAKAGGPNYVLQLMEARQRDWPPRVDSPTGLAGILPRLERPLESEAQRRAFHAAVGSYARAWSEVFAVVHDPTLLLGQDNELRYRPVAGLVVRFGPGGERLAVSSALAAASICGTRAVLSLDPREADAHAFLAALGDWPHEYESDDALAARLAGGGVARLRCVGAVGAALRRAAETAGVHCAEAPVLANGRIELLRYVREQALSVDYHRHGNLGEREGEPRAPVA